MSSIKIAPRPMLAGITRRLSLPKSMREMWGISRPTQPIRPHMDTTEAVIIVEARITSTRRRLTFTPSVCASSSFSDSTFSRQRSAKIIAVPAQQQRLEIGGREAAHQPEGDGRQHVLGVGDVFNHRHQRRKQRADHHAAQNNHHHVRSPAHAADGIDDRDRQHSHHQRAHLRQKHIAAQQNAQRRAEGRARRHAQRVRRGQRIGKQSLK